MFDVIYCRNCREPLDSSAAFCRHCSAAQHPPARPLSSSGLSQQGVHSRGDFGNGQAAGDQKQILFVVLAVLFGLVAVWGYGANIRELMYSVFPADPVRRLGFFAGEFILPTLLLTISLVFTTLARSRSEQRQPFRQGRRHGIVPGMRQSTNFGSVIGLCIALGIGLPVVATAFSMLVDNFRLKNQRTVTFRQHKVQVEMSADQVKAELGDPQESRGRKTDVNGIVTDNAEWVYRDVSQELLVRMDHDRVKDLVLRAPTPPMQPPLLHMLPHGPHASGPSIPPPPVPPDFARPATPGQDPAVQQYVETVDRIRERNVTLAEQIVTLGTQASQNPDLLRDLFWKKQATALFDEVDAAAMELGQITPVPGPCLQADRTAKDMSRETHLYVEDVRKWLQFNDLAALNRSLEHSRAVRTLGEELGRELQSLSL